jgi:tetratricopeptide (TPR) repeat protein
MDIMRLRTHVLLIALIALTGFASPCFASTHSNVKTPVSSRILPNGARVAFEWESGKEIAFKVSTKGNQIFLHFDQPVKLEWSKSLAALKPYVKKVEVKNNSTVVLTLNKISHIQYFMSYDKHGIDLLFKKNKTPILRLDIPEPESERHAKSASPAFHVQAKHTKMLEASHTPSPVVASTSKDAAGLAALSPAAGSATGPQQTAEAKQTLQLTIKQATPFAVFIAQKKLWVVANGVNAIPADAIHKTGTSFSKDIQKLQDPHASIYYLPLIGNPSAYIGKSAQGNAEIILADKPQKPVKALIPSLITNEAKQSSIAIAADTADTVISFHDPMTGDNLNAIPLSIPGTALTAPRSFVEFNLLQAAQGIAIQKNADTITVSAKAGKVEIASPKGLTISPETAEQMQEKEAEPVAANVLFPYARWKLDDDKNLVPTEIKLFHDIAFSPAETANKARLKLLGIYLSQGLFDEAHGMADDILRVSYKFYRDNKVSALRGAAHFFKYRLQDAERDFSAAELSASPEATMWRNLCRELLNEGSEKFNFLANYDSFIHAYPPLFIQKLAIVAADRSINRKEYDTALAIFDLLKKDNLDQPVAKYVDYMHAKIFSETKREDEAIKIWERQAAEVDDPLIRARAEFSLINMLLRQDKITHADAIKRLEKLRIVWRGDNLELNTLTLLSNLYIQEKQYSNALHALRDIVLYYSEMPEAITTAQQMEETFITLYNKGGADSMQPLEALSLFYEFRDLVPIGKEGDQMIRNLADRLVNIDLLDRAALLLDHQIRKRLQGDERSRVGARLALIYLLNHQPKEALETLKTTGYGDLPPDLQLIRIRLTAQALAQQGNPEKAVEVLSPDNSAEGSLLRLSIYWDNKDWANVITNAEEFLGNRNDPSAALTPTESDVLLKLATAYVYEHDSGQIQYLRDYFTPLLKTGPNKDSFLFITSESGTIDYANLSNLDVDIKEVKSFLDTYREQVKKNGLSKAIN